MKLPQLIKNPPALLRRRNRWRVQKIQMTKVMTILRVAQAVIPSKARLPRTRVWPIAVVAAAEAAVAEATAATTVASVEAQEGH